MNVGANGKAQRDRAAPSRGVPQPQYPAGNASLHRARRGKTVHVSASVSGLPMDVI